MKRKKVIGAKELGISALALVLIGTAGLNLSEKDYSKYLDKPGMQVNDTYLPANKFIKLYDDFFLENYYADHMQEKDKVYLKLGDNDTRKYVIKDIKETDYEPYELEIEAKENPNYEVFKEAEENTYTNYVDTTKKVMKVSCKAHHRNHTFTTYEKAKTLSYSK